MPTATDKFDGDIESGETMFGKKEQYEECKNTFKENCIIAKGNLRIQYGADSILSEEIYKP
ncbi:hypothetical protein SYK_14310 [Pseudodesulfovibrio nedwellii]|uniref:Organic solvent tolerance-like N-terminal domain-containing protein n=1 Tax=Pseudodesulfovibrio nedwellii TaxID=2973072 RepID=A0ABN6S5M7_9BACT|nr:hypothetical protein SYK_14310 [Pseudodesulfovibrio nedwellii]